MTARGAAASWSAAGLAVLGMAAYLLLPALSVSGHGLRASELARDGTAYEAYVALTPLLALPVAAVALAAVALGRGKGAALGAPVAAVSAMAAAGALSGLGAFILARRLDPVGLQVTPGPGLVVAGVAALAALAAGLARVAWPAGWAERTATLLPLAGHIVGPWVPAALEGGVMLDDATLSVLGTVDPLMARYAAATRILVALAAAAALAATVVPPRWAHRLRRARTGSLALACGASIGSLVTLHRLGATPTGYDDLALALAALAALAWGRTTSLSSDDGAVAPPGDP